MIWLVILSIACFWGGVGHGAYERGFEEGLTDGHSD